MFGCLVRAMCIFDRVSRAGRFAVGFVHLALDLVPHWMPMRGRRVSRFADLMLFMFFLDRVGSAGTHVAHFVYFSLCLVTHPAATGMNRYSEETDRTEKQSAKREFRSSQMHQDLQVQRLHCRQIGLPE